MVPRCRKAALVTLNEQFGGHIPPEQVANVLDEKLSDLHHTQIALAFNRTALELQKSINGGPVQFRIADTNVLMKAKEDGQNLKEFIPRCNIQIARGNMKDLEGFEKGQKFASYQSEMKIPAMMCALKDTQGVEQQHADIYNWFLKEAPRKEEDRRNAWDTGKGLFPADAMLATEFYALNEAGRKTMLYTRDGDLSQALKQHPETRKYANLIDFRLPEE